jgi:uncharacterized protein YjbI with pentapeptide repeats
MNKQAGKRSATSQRRSSKKRKAERPSELIGQHYASSQRPTSNDRAAWYAYWQAQGQPWRTEPEVDTNRQAYLADRRAIKPDIMQNIYPFKNIKLNRADVEWLLATHENERGPVDLSDEEQRGRVGLDLRGAILNGEDLHGLPLTRLCAGFNPIDWKIDNWRKASVEQREGAAVYLEGANLFQAHLEEASLWRSHLERANLEDTHLEGAILFRAHLEGANLSSANLAGVNLRSAFFDNVSTLRDVIPNDANHGFMSVADVRWSGVNLALVMWPHVSILGDEHEAKQKQRNGKVKDKATRLAEYEQAVRANRQLATVLREQGLNEEAARFFYRSQVLQRTAFWFQMNENKVALLQRVQLFSSWFFSWFLYLLAGYGYRPLRSIIIYLLVIVSFAAGYYEMTHVLHAQPYPLAWYEALVLSVSSFHGRGFFQPVKSLGDPVAILASVEAVFGLMIEISFIATFTQRYFGK